MNRADRRKKVPAKSAKLLAEASYYEGIQYATSGIYASLILILHDKWGFGHARLTRLLDQVTDQFDSIKTGYVKIDDLKRTIKEELGIIMSDNNMNDKVVK